MECFDIMTSTALHAPKVSIGLPVFNGARYLRAAIDSLLAQTYRDFRLLIVDNASTDDTGLIAEAYAARDPRVGYHRNHNNIGAAPNFNLAYHLTSGPYFKWAAHDDLVEPGFLAACVKALDAHPEVVLATTEIDIIDDEGRSKGPHDEQMPHLMDDRPSARFADMILADHHCIDIFGLIRRDVLATTPLHARYIGSDRNLLAELSLRGKIFRVPELLFHNREHAGRSVRIDVRARLGWFDPTLADKITMPFFRAYFEYGRTVATFPMSARERVACLAAMVEWIPGNRYRLTADARGAVKALSARAARKRAA
jgi:glycosyltransferase involved in cell wall biosynthesis